VDQDGEQEAHTFDRATVYQSAFDGAIRHFIDCLRSGKAFETSLADNLLTLRLVEDAYRSI
jgi:predicted dehydrogenase